MNLFRCCSLFCFLCRSLYGAIIAISSFFVPSFSYCKAWWAFWLVAKAKTTEDSTVMTDRKFILLFVTDRRWSQRQSFCINGMHLRMHRSYLKAHVLQWILLVVGSSNYQRPLEGRMRFYIQHSTKFFWRTSDGTEWYHRISVGAIIPTHHRSQFYPGTTVASQDSQPFCSCIIPNCELQSLWASIHDNGFIIHR